MGILSVTPNLELTSHGFVPGLGPPIQDDPGTTYYHTDPRDGPLTDYFIRDLAYNNNAPPMHHPLYARVDPRSRERYAADRANEELVRVRQELAAFYARNPHLDPSRQPNRDRAKRRLHPIAQSVKRPRR